MSDITLCTGHWCKARAECYRFRAVPSDFGQSWTQFDGCTEECKFFVPIQPGALLRPENWPELQP